MCVSINGSGDLRPFDIETGMRVTSKVGNLPSKFGNARPSDSRFNRYVRDGRTDGRTDKSNTYCPLLYVRGHNNKNRVNTAVQYNNNNL